MLALLFFLLLVWVALGIVGVAVKGLLWLLIVAGILFAATLVIGGFVRGRSKS